MSTLLDSITEVEKEQSQAIDDLKTRTKPYKDDRKPTRTRREKWLTRLVLLLMVVVTGFALFSYTQYRELNTLMVAQGKIIGGRIGTFSEGIDQRVVDNQQMVGVMSEELLRLSEDLDRETQARGAEISARFDQVDNITKDLRLELQQLFSRLTRRISLLEARVEKERVV
jgi:hypothetical protein